MDLKCERIHAKKSLTLVFWTLKCFTKHRQSSLEEYSMNKTLNTSLNKKYIEKPPVSTAVKCILALKYLWSYYKDVCKNYVNEFYYG